MVRGGGLSGGWGAADVLRRMLVRRGWGWGVGIKAWLSERKGALRSC